MIAVTATFAVLKRQISPASIQVLTILTNLADIEPHDAIAPALPTIPKLCGLPPNAD
jgi:hypothetical protein